MAEDMQRAKFKEEEPEVATGPKTGPAGESSSRSGSLEQDSPMVGIKEEAAGESMKARTGPKKKRRRLPPVAKGTWRPVLGPELPLTSPLDRTHLEQYMNESLQQWFRLEFLMDYDYQGNKLHCMMCTTTLSSLSLTDIKHHILDNHPTSLQFSPTQKSVILDAWINRKETPEVEIEEDLTPEVEMEEDLTPEVEEDLTPEGEEDLTSEVEVEEDKTPDGDMEADMNDDEADKKLAKKAVKGDRVTSRTIKRPENRILKSKSFGDLMEKDIKSAHNLGLENNSSRSAQLIEEENLEPTNVELLEEEESPTGDVRLPDNKERNTKQVHLLADQEWKARKKHLLGSNSQILEEQQKVKEGKKPEAREGQVMEEEKRKAKESHLLVEEQKTRERQLEEPEKIREATVLKEEKQKAREAKLLEEVKRKVKEVQLLEGEKMKAKEAQLLEEDKRRAKESELLEEEKNKAKEAQLLEKEKKVTMEAQLLEEEGRKAKEAQPAEEDNKTDKEAQLLEEEKSKIREAQMPQKQGVEERRLEQEKLKEQEVQSVTGEIIVKTEDHQYAELPKDEKEESQTAKNFQAEKQQIHQQIMEGAKTHPSEPGKHQIQVQQVQQAPAVLGIGLPVLKDQGLSIVKAPDCDSLEADEEESSWSGVMPEGKGASWEFAFGRLQGKVNDPRKYQHDRWNLEFLMDYTPAKDGLICMVCGATLMNPKITTVKMHIQQKHPDTTYLSDQEKAVVMEEWEQKMAASKKAAGQQQGDDEICIEINEDATNSETNGSTVAASSPHPEIILPTFSKTPKSTPSLPPPCNSAKRNYQVRWRTEFMMDYDCRREGLICMVCGGTLATLKVSTIKRHIVQVHPYSVDFTAEERQRILEAYSEMALHYIHSEDCFKTQPQEEVRGRKRRAPAVEES
ncbi:hypothetical protein GDO78_003703 [Eleutherodactylus coqui]|uniref:SPIN-DOC-like zinc-finger domain-containing protein n=1 Tax=Eleutherodactylus coqui TaxID=57060 RepID=A0A8J6EVA2_ELECQ|nr:hypothetical protein GDO78_003703 [Eleutherodactylus coqui]